MLVLQRKAGEAIHIGDDIIITITEIGSDKVKIAIDAPKSIPIVRQELLTAADTNKESIATQSDISLLKNILANKKNNPKNQGNP